MVNLTEKSNLTQNGSDASDGGITRAPLRATRRDDALAGLGGVWMVLGLFIDGWAHRNDKPETFFTPWHAVLYSGFLASVLWMLAVIRRGQADGRSFRQAVPEGYGVRMIGLAIFATGAMGDLLWHSIFGVEVNLEALLSPSHLLLLVGGLTMAVGPIASTNLRAPLEATWSSVGSAIGSIVFITSVLLFFLMYESPFTDLFFTVEEMADARSEGGGWLRYELQSHAIASVLITTLVVGSALIYLIRTFPVPRGAFVVVLTVPVVLVSGLDAFELGLRTLGFLLAAIIAELVWPKVVASQRVVVLAGFVASIFMAAWFVMFGVIWQTESLGWEVEFWAGVSILSGILIGLLTLVACKPPAQRFVSVTWK